MTYLSIDVAHYVYCHIRPDTNSIFYIGKGSGKRLTGRQQRSLHWKNIVSKCGGFKAEIIASGLTENEAYSFERKLIQSIREQTDIKLCNLVDGGKGGSFNPSQETREKQRLAKLGGKHTEEHKNKIAEANKRRVYKKGYKINLTEEGRKLRSEIARNQIWTEDRKNKISAAKMGHVVSAETRRKISETKKANRLKGK